MDVENINIAIQILLTKNNHFKGKVDGKFTEPTYDAIRALFKSYGIITKGWRNTRLRIAAEQALYKSEGIQVGKLDGKIGPLTLQAREEFKAKLTLNWRDKTEEVQEYKPIKPIVVNTTTKIVPYRTWPDRNNVIPVYGKVGSNQDTLTMPFPMRIAWDRSEIIRSYSCHKLVKPAMERAWNRTFEYYGHQKIKELGIDLFGGCLNVRKMRGGSAWSKHAWGIAIDIDPARNSLKTPWKQAQMSKPEYKKFIEFWYDEGAINLGIERNYDAMHFEFTSGWK